MSENCTYANQKTYPFTLPALPYAETALAPHMSAETFSYHYHKHHNTYVVNLNKLVENTALQGKSLEEIIELSYKDAGAMGIFNNAAQVWNHSFFWHSMKSDGGGAPTGAVADKINEAFGSYENFSVEFKNAALTQFGSGWAWLVLDENNKLAIMKTGNADLPMVHNKSAILTLDVWEHAYYIDYRNLRANYCDMFLNHLVNWDFANEMLKAASK